MTVVCCAGSDAIRVEASQEVTCQDTLYLLEEITRQRYELTVLGCVLLTMFTADIYWKYLRALRARSQISLNISGNAIFYVSQMSKGLSRYLGQG